MKPGTCINSPASQRGDALIEAMVGVVLTAIIGLGLSYTASRAVKSQRYLNTQNAVISQMRESLASTHLPLSAICDTGSVPSLDVAGNAITTTAVCSKGTVSVGVGTSSGHSHEGGAGKTGLTLTLPASSVVTSLTVESSANETNAALVGGDGKMAVSL